MVTPPCPQLRTWCASNRKCRLSRPDACMTGEQPRTGRVDSVDVSLYNAPGSITPSSTSPAGSGSSRATALVHWCYARPHSTV
jgi:hypothetical protein